MTKIVLKIDAEILALLFWLKTSRFWRIFPAFCFGLIFSWFLKLFLAKESCFLCLSDSWPLRFSCSSMVSQPFFPIVILAYTLFQNGRHFSILLLTWKLALVASFKGKYSLEFRFKKRGNKGYFDWCITSIRVILDFSAVLHCTHAYS